MHLVALFLSELEFVFGVLAADSWARNSMFRLLALAFYDPDRVGVARGRNY